MTVEFFGSDKVLEVNLNSKNTVSDAFKALNLPIETHIVSKDNIIITEFEELSDNDKLMFIKVASGG